MNKLEKVLTRKADKTVESGEAVVESVKLLLDNNQAAERKLLGAIGLDSDIRYAEMHQADLVTRNKNQKELEKTIIHIDEIRDFCLQYRLYLRPARMYDGHLPDDLGPELLRFTKEKKIAVGNDSAYSNFYIIAPPKMFSDYKSPIQMVKRAFDFTLAESAERKRLAELDPILIYKLDESINGPGYYAVIKSWGEDFTPLRRIYGVLTTKFVINLISFFMHLLPGIISLFAGVWIINELVINLNTKENAVIIEFGYLMLILCTVTFGVGFFIYWMFSDDCSDFRNYFRKNIPTENNWNQGREWLGKVNAEKRREMEREIENKIIRRERGW